MSPTACAGHAGETAPVPVTAAPAAWNAGAGGPDAETAVGQRRNAICACAPAAASSVASSQDGKTQRIHFRTAG